MFLFLICCIDRETCINLIQVEIIKVLMVGGSS